MVVKGAHPSCVCPPCSGRQRGFHTPSCASSPSWLSKELHVRLVHSSPSWLSKELHTRLVLARPSVVVKGASRPSCACTRPSVVVKGVYTPSKAHPLWSSKRLLSRLDFSTRCGRQRVPPSRLSKKKSISSSPHIFRSSDLPFFIATTNNTTSSRSSLQWWFTKIVINFYHDAAEIRGSHPDRPPPKPDWFTFIRNMRLF